MRKLRKLEKALIIILLFLAIVFGTGMGILVSSFEDTTDIDSLEDFKPEIPSKIFDRNGNLISELFTVKREPVTFEKLPKNLVNALLAIEDIQFFSHRGIHVKRVFGALLVNIKTGKPSQGASTITMQLARTLFTGREKTIVRKLKETWLALKIEKKYSKNEILTLYFNQIYFGHGAYGIEAATQFYFNKHVEDLTLAECALLAGLPQSPNRLSPIKNPQLARRRQELVLESMIQNKMITSEEAYNSFQDFWVNFRLLMRSPSQSVHLMAENRAPHFIEYVRQKLEKLYGSKRIYTDGLKVYTSLDLTQQVLAEKYLREGLNRQNLIYNNTMNMVRENLDKKILDSLDMLSLLFDLDTLDIGSHKNEERILSYLDEHLIAPLDMLSFLFDADHINRVIESSYRIDKSAGEFQKVEGALLAMEPKTGYITAMVGGSDFTEDNQFNRAIQIRRQTGSGFKPYIYTAAIDTKIFNPASIIVDSPVVFYDGDEEYIPDNYGGLYHGKVRLREALRRSINIVTAKIVDRLGVETVVKYASSILGITDPSEIEERFPKVYSIALGVVELSPYEQAKGFATFANQGQEVTPIAVLYVLDRDGNLIDNFEADLRKEQMSKGVRQIIPETTNFIVLDMLRDVMRPGGTGYRAAIQNEFTRPAAGKTGTTQNWKDAWFSGFTPDLVASVWVGFDRNSISLGRGQAGGIVAGPIWAQFMRDALKDISPSWYSRPKGVYSVKVCRESGLLPTKYCTNTITEYFLDGTIPTEYCYECRGGKKEESFNVEIFQRKKTSSKGDSDSRSKNKILNIEEEEVSPYEEESLFYDLDETGDGAMSDTGEAFEESEPVLESGSPPTHNSSQPEDQPDDSTTSIEQPAFVPQIDDSTGQDANNTHSETPSSSEDAQETGDAGPNFDTTENDPSPEAPPEEGVPVY